MLGLGFSVFGILAVKLALLFSRHGVTSNATTITAGSSQMVIRGLWRGAFEDCAVGSMCILGWYLMRRRSPASMTTGAISVSLGLMILFRRWIYWQLHKGNGNVVPWLEPLIIWSFFLYVISYGFLGVDPKPLRMLPV